MIIAAEAGAKIIDLGGAVHTLRAKATIAATPGLTTDISQLITEAQAKPGAPCA